jgi:fluoride exporter
MIGAAVGGVCRFVISTAIAERFAGRFPLPTFLVNITGSFGIGVLMTLLSDRFSNPYLRLLLVVGVLGGYTTFSSFEWETFTATRDGAAWIGLAYVMASVCAGYIAVWLGAFLTRALLAR